jgi:hypothetical protein
MQFYSGATGQAGRFSEGFCLRRVHRRRSRETLRQRRMMRLPAYSDQQVNLYCLRSRNIQ